MDDERDCSSLRRSTGNLGGMSPNSSGLGAFTKKTDHLGSSSSNVTIG